MTKAYLAGMIASLTKSGNQNPFPLGDSYTEYEQGYENGWDIRMGNEAVGMETA